MGSKKTYTERIDELKARQKKLQAQEKALLARQVHEEKREQTKRIFAIGKMIEEELGHPVDDTEMELIRNAIRNIPGCTHGENSSGTPMEKTHETSKNEISLNRFS